MIRSYLGWLIIFIIISPHSTRADLSDFPSVSFDSAAISKVDRYLSELESYGEILKSKERQTIVSIIVYSRFGKLAIENFELFHAFGRRRVLRMMIQGDSLFTLGDVELLAATFGEHYNLRVINAIVLLIELELVSIETPAVAQATRDLLNAWKDVRDEMLRMSPLLQKLVESGVLDADNSP